MRLILTTGGRANEFVIVVVGCTMLQEHAFARPDTAASRCGFCVGVASAVVPLDTTESMTSSATAATALAARGTIGWRVVVAVSVTVVVVMVNTRVVEIVVVVDAALVVIVLHHHQLLLSRKGQCKTNMAGMYSTTIVPGPMPRISLQNVWIRSGGFSLRSS